MATDYTDPGTALLYAEGPIAHDLTFRPVIIRMIDELGSLEGLTIADIGAGDGSYALRFASRGANVLAIDRSAAQARIAQAKNPHPRVNYIVGDATTHRFPPLDHAFMNMVIPALGTPGDLDSLLQRIAPALKGKLIMTALHPLYFANAEDEIEVSTTFDPRRYSDDGHLYESVARTYGGGTITFTETHFSLGRISLAIERAGMVIETMRESMPLPQKGLYLPKFLAFRLSRR